MLTVIIFVRWDQGFQFLLLFFSFQIFFVVIYCFKMENLKKKNKKPHFKCKNESTTKCAEYTLKGNINFLWSDDNEIWSEGAT